MIKCINCRSNKVFLKIEESNYMVINECFNCYNIIHLFIDDYILNYKDYYSLNLNQNKTLNNDKITNLCQKHNKSNMYFCFVCKINLCDECLQSHDRIIHSIKETKEIITEKEKEQIEEYKKILTLLKEEINNKISFYKNNKKEEDYIKLLNSFLNIIQLKNYYLNLNISDEFINSYDIISLKFILDKYNKEKIKSLINNIKNNSYEEKDNDIKKYKQKIFYSINSIPKNKIINYKYNGWINHVIQLRNGNIMSAHWDFLVVYKINKENNKLEIIQRININNGSINHIYEYKYNKILICDNKMKIVQLSPDNKNFKCLNILDYGRKIIPFIPNSQIYNENKKFLFMCTPNGIKLYSYLENDNFDIDNNNNDFIFKNEEIENDLKFIGLFSNEYDYSAIIQIDNKICGIYKVKNNINNHFAAWEINYDFNKESNFDVNEFNLLGEIKNVNCSIGRYSISKLNNEYVIIGIMKNGYHSYFPNEKSGINIISLDTIEIVQFIQTDEITSLECLKNGIILSGGKDLYENKYYIKQWKYDYDKKELLYIGGKIMHSDFINVIGEIKDGFFLSCGRDGNIYIFYNYN